MNSPLSLTGQSWRQTKIDPEQVSRLSEAHALPPAVAACLASRVSEESAARWLEPRLDDLHDPYEIHGMDIAVQRIEQAVAERQRVRIVTDYDVDGTTSSLILQGTLRILGAGQSLSYHIPDRFEEGYGFSTTAAERAISDDVALIITADIGVRDHAAVTTASAGGVDVIICDHHLPAGESVPADALAVLCPPKQGCPYPNKALAACGVSLKLAQALLRDHPRRTAIIQSMLKIAAIGTVADVVDLSTPENRTIVSHGLRELRRGPHRPGLRALLEVSGLTNAHVEASDLGFRLGPRINAAGRLKSATAVIELFDAPDLSEARARASILDDLNNDRRKIQDQLVAQALEQLSDPVPPFVVVAGDESAGWHRGVVGIVASKIRDRIHRPVAVVSVQGSVAVASVRSTPSVHAVHALDAVSDLLVRYGGHPVAAGFTVNTSDLPSLRRRLEDWTSQTAGTGVVSPTLTIDTTCVPDEVNLDLAVSIAKLGPFGKGNRAPVIQVNGVVPSDLRVLKERHLKFRVGGIDTIWFGAAQHRPDIEGRRIDVAGRVEINRWRGRETVQLKAEDVRLAPAPTP